MNTILKPILLALALLGAIRAAAMVPATLSTGWSGAQTIPDNNASGLAFSFNFAAGSPLFITDVTVGFTIVGGWNGDLYATLSHASGFSVLLNRIGSSAANPGGSAVSGLSIELSDHYLEDVHTATANPLTGNFAPDGRFVNPFTTLDTDSRTARFDSFTGLDPNGNWTLFIADVSPLAVSTIQSWTVTVGVAVPEPGRMALIGLALGMGLICHRPRQ